MIICHEFSLFSELGELYKPYHQSRQGHKSPVVCSIKIVAQNGCNVQAIYGTVHGVRYGDAEVAIAHQRINWQHIEIREEMMNETIIDCQGNTK